MPQVLSVEFPSCVQNLENQLNVIEGRNAMPELCESNTFSKSLDL